MTYAYSNAAGSCSGPRGGHGPGKTGNGGFELTGNVKEVENGGVVQLNLHGSTPFRGYLITLSEDRGLLSELGKVNIRFPCSIEPVACSNNIRFPCSIEPVACSNER